MPKLTDYQRKQLLRLTCNAIDHQEFVRWGKRPVSVIYSLRDLGLAQCTSFDGDNEPVDPETADGDCFWFITDAGLAAIGKQA